MNVPLLIVAFLIGWTCVAFAFAPWLGAAIAGRRMTPTERDQLGWGCLGLAAAVLLLAVLIGARP